MMRSHVLDRQRHDELISLLNAHFNADWDSDYDSWQEAVDQWVRWGAPAARQVVVALNEVLPQLRTDADADRLLESIGFSGWSAERMGGSKLAWLQELRAEFISRLAREAEHG